MYNTNDDTKSQSQLLRQNLRFPLLTAEAYQAVKDGAKSFAIGQLPAPVKEIHSAGFLAQYPRQFKRLVVALLVLVIVVSFPVSSGKQTASILLTLKDIVPVIPLGNVWLILAVIAGLVLSEAGAILFMLIAVPLSVGRPIVRAGFRFYAIWCAALSIVGNILISAQHTNNLDWLGSIYLWMSTLIYPALVLGIGMVLESGFSQSIHDHAQTEAKYLEALTAYQKQLADYESLPDYKSSFVSGLLVALRRANPHVGKLLKADPHSRNWILAMEYRAQQQLNSVDLNAEYSADEGSEMNGGENTGSQNDAVNADIQDVQAIQAAFNAEIQAGATRTDATAHVLKQFPHLETLSVARVAAIIGASVGTVQAARQSLKEVA